MKQHGLFKPQPMKQPPNPYTKTHQANLVKCHEKITQALSEAQQITAGVSSLPDAYQKRKTAQSSVLSYFTTPSSDRPEAIDLITSIAESLKLQSRAPKTNLHALRAEKRRMAQELSTMSSIVDGSYVYVSQDIQESYQDAWWNTDPNASQLYVEISERTGEKSNEEKISCLMALQSYLQTDAARATVKFGTKNLEIVLAKITAQMDALSHRPSVQLM